MKELSTSPGLKTDLDIKTELAGLAAQDLEILPAHNKQIVSYIQAATLEQPLTLLAPVCPDFPDRGGHELGDGVSALAEEHLVRDAAVIDLLDCSGVPYRYVVAVADSEAAHDLQVQTYAGDDVEAFLSRCEASRAAIEGRLEAMAAHHQGEFVATTFYQRYGLEDFHALEAAYLTELTDLLEAESHQSREAAGVARKLKGQLHLAVFNRGAVHERAYGRRQAYDLEAMRMLELRGIAQNLALGRLVTVNESLPVMAVHNQHVRDTINQRNRYPLDGDKSGQQLPVPMIRYK